MNTEQNIPKKKPKGRRKPTKKQRRRRRQTLIAAIALVVLLSPFLAAGILWWRGLLPTREELPRYKERLMIVLQGWKHTALPEAEVIGIDVSHYQSAVNYAELCFHLDSNRQMYSSAKKDTKPRKVDFVVAKATQGSMMRDNCYNRNKQGCREQDILFGAYHFYSLQSSAKAQADNFIRFSGLQKGDIVPVIDVEPVGGSLPQRDSVIKWLTIVEKYYGARPLVYTNEKTYLTYFLIDNRFKKYPFWIARYGGREPSRHHVMWQYAESGRVGGISGPVDVNIFRGTMTDLKHLYTIP